MTIEKLHNEFQFCHYLRTRVIILIFILKLFLKKPTNNCAQEVPMEKISGILPEKPRLKTDSDVMVPVRPGAPSFGRAQGSSEIQDRVTLSSVKNIGTQEIQKFRNPKEAKHVQIVDDLSKKFFLNQTQKDIAKEPISNNKMNSKIEVLDLAPEPEASFAQAQGKDFVDYYA